MPEELVFSWVLQKSSSDFSWTSNSHSGHTLFPECWLPGGDSSALAFNI